MNRHPRTRRIPAAVATLATLATVAALAVATTLTFTPTLLAEDAEEEIMPGPTHAIHHLGWLAGTWRSPVKPLPPGQVKSGQQWEAVYTTNTGDEILSATKGMKGGETFMYDFERFFKRGEDVILVPFPGGKQSVEFKLVDYELGAEKAVFENPEHDFPKKLVYEITAPDHLLISVLGGDGKGFKLDLVRAR